MKRKIGLLALLLSFSLLAACSAQGQSHCPPADETPNHSAAEETPDHSTVDETPNHSAAEETPDHSTVDETPVTTDEITCVDPPVNKWFRIVDGAGDGSLLLAGLDGGTGDVYRLSSTREGIEIYLDGEKADASALEDGMPILVTWDGTVMETFPAQFSGVTTIEAWSTGDVGERDDRCGLYLQVLEDLWEKDAALNEGLEVLGLDLSALTHLSESEKSAVAHRFGELHGLEVVTGTMAQLLDQGYITMRPLAREGTDVLSNKYFYEWENGILYSITTDEDAVWNLPMLTEGEEAPSLTAFTAHKWRTSLGAYGFSGCIAQKAKDGSWSYTVGAEFIS